MASLKYKTLTSIFWSLTDSFSTYFIRFCFSVAIARKLDPSDYGLMGMILIFMAISSIIIEGGFGMALIQKQDTNRDDFSTVFYVNLTISLIIYAILYLLAPTIAQFYNEKELIYITRVASLTIVISALGTIQVTILSKELNFKRQAYISLVSVIFSGITGIIIAFLGYGVWALVFQTMAGAISRLILLWYTSKWMPSFVFNYHNLKLLYGFGYKIFLQGISDVLISKIYLPLIGKYFSTEQLGYYSTANSFSEIIVKQTTIAYGRVLFPVISSIQNDLERIKNSYMTIFTILAFVMFPISIVAIVTIPYIVDFLLTAKWLSSVLFMQLFLIEGFFFALYMLNQNTLNALGKSGISLQIDIIKKSFTFLSLIITINSGIISLIIGQIASSLLAFFYSIYIIRQNLKIKMILISIDIIKLSLIVFIMVLINYFFIEKLFSKSYYLIITNVSLMPIIYLFFSYILKVKGLKEITVLFSKKVPLPIINIINKRYK